jgi:NAD(P)-dependent dehydrogenase (short-subunit alcohol dehydrogenase family)
LREQLEINVVGPVRLTQALLPLVRTARGRVVNVGSVSGRMTFPFVGAYSASKSAMRAVTEALRMELRPDGVWVALIEPGNVATKIWDRAESTGAQIRQTLPSDIEQRYGERLDQLRVMLAKMRPKFPGPARVTAAVRHALTSRRPRATYLCGWDARALLALNFVPTFLRDRLRIRLSGGRP